MNETTIKGLRQVASEVLGVKDESYKLLDGKGRCVMFGITKERAESYLIHYKGGRVVRM